MAALIQTYWLWIVLGVLIVWFLSKRHGASGRGMGTHSPQNRGDTHGSPEERKKAGSSRRGRGCC